MADGMLAILGAGTMGAGLAALALGRGVDVVLVESDQQVAAAAQQKVRQDARLGRLLGGYQPREVGEARLTVTTDLARAASASAVIECVTETADAKHAVLSAVSELVRPGTLLITNTSAIPVDELAAFCARPEDLVGAHFMNPPYLIRAVEVVRGPRTSADAMDRARALLAELDRDGIEVGDGPGFVINRVLQRMINEAARIVEDGVASPEAVDALFTGCLGHRTGPLATGDLIGLDNVVQTLDVLAERTGDVGYRPCGLLTEMVREGRLGRKSGRGFHDYEQEQAKA